MLFGAGQRQYGIPPVIKDLFKLGLNIFTKVLVSNETIGLSKVTRQSLGFGFGFTTVGDLLSSPIGK